MWRLMIWRWSRNWSWSFLGGKFSFVVWLVVVTMNESRACVGVYINGLEAKNRFIYINKKRLGIFSTQKTGAD